MQVTLLQRLTVHDCMNSKEHTIIVIHSFTVILKRIEQNLIQSRLLLLAPLKQCIRLVNLDFYSNVFC